MLRNLCRWTIANGDCCKKSTIDFMNLLRLVVQFFGSPVSFRLIKLHTGVGVGDFKNLR